eukprot:1044554-Heterocapsa_arctica.AAC.1
MEPNVVFRPIRAEGHWALLTVKNDEVGATKADTELGHELICKALRKRGFILHDLVEASREVETVGIVFRGGDSRTL